MAALHCEVPDLQDELDRKVYETLETLYGRFETGQITSNEFHTGLESLYGCVSGLLRDDKGFNELVVKLQKQVKKGTSVVTKVLQKDGEVIVVSWGVGTDRVSYVNTNKNEQKVREFSDEKTAKKAFIQLAKFLRSKDYEWVA